MTLQVDGPISEQDIVSHYSEILSGETILNVVSEPPMVGTLRGTLRGRVEGVQNHRNVIFLTLETSAGLQLVFTPDVLGTSDFERARGIAKGDRLEAYIETEPATRPTARQPVRLRVRAFELLPSGQLSHRAAEISIEQARSRVLLASIARSASQYLLTKGWTEIAPVTISAGQVAQAFPLQVIFPGLGAETTLVVSPLAQLVETAQILALRKVFAVSRQYSRAIRDGFTSSEALAITAVSLDRHSPATIEGDLAQVEGLINAALAPISATLGANEKRWIKSSWPIREMRTVSELTPVTQPTHIVSHMADTDVYRAVWPQPFALVEGHVRHLETGHMFVATLHCERLARLSTGVHYRRLQDSPELD